MTRPLWLIGGVLLLSLPLMGMKCTAEAHANCKSSSGCEAGGSVKGEWEMLRNATKGAFATLTTSFDAANFVIDVSESSVTLPDQGNVTIQLINSSTNAIQASRTFPWVRAGTVLRLADPVAVNAWAQQNGGNADSFNYELESFYPSGQIVGLNTLATTSKYNGEVQSSASTTWRGLLCPYDDAARGVNPRMRYCGPRY